MPVPAQEPTPPDTARAPPGALQDTAQTPPGRQDTTAADTTPPPRLPDYPDAAGVGWHNGVWEWDRDALLRTGAFTLLELIERVPGLTAIRSGIWGQPEVLAAPGGGPGRVEVRLDGFALDGLRSPAYDLAGLELIHLEKVRVERWGDRVRILLTSFTPTDYRPETLIEAATGDQDTNLFRGSLRTPSILGGPLAVALERLTTDGIAPTGAANRSAFWAKWSLASGASGVQMELRNTSVERSGPEGAGTVQRSDWVARARTRFAAGLTAAGYVGGSAVDDTLGEAVTRRSGLQAGLRAALDTGIVHLDGAVRFRTLDALPGTTAETNLALGPLHGLAVGAFVRHEAWGDAGSALSWGGHASLGPVWGIRPVVRATGGTVGVPFRPGTAAPLLHEGRTVRLGGEFRRWGLQLAGALVRVESDSMPALGLPFEDGSGPFAGVSNDFFEASVRIPTGFDPLWLEASYTRARDSVSTVYTPEEGWRGAIVYHHLPLASGNLEIQARLEHWRRGAFLIPDGSGGRATVPRIGQYDFFLHIRVVTVRAFLRWENFTLRRENYDLPEHIFPIQRVYYGVKWTFFQ